MDKLIPMSDLYDEENNQVIPLSDLLDEETGLPQSIQGARRVFIPGVDPISQDELQMAYQAAGEISLGDEFRQSGSQLIRSFSKALAGLPEAIGIAATELEKKYPIGAATWGAPTDPEKTWSGTAARWIKGAGEFAADIVGPGEQKPGRCRMISGPLKFQEESDPPLDSWQVVDLLRVRHKKS